MQNGGANPIGAWPAALKALDDRSIQGWVNNAQVQRRVDAAGWDGALRPTADADFLAVVDTNMGYNKVDAAIQRALEYSVTWPDGR